MSFWPKGAAKPGGVKRPSAIKDAICLVDRRIEQGRGQKLQILPLVDAGLADKRHSFAEHFDHRGAEEIAAELHQIGRLRRVGDYECFLSDRIEQGSRLLNRGSVSTGNDEQPSRGRDIRPAEYRSGHKMLVLFSVHLGQSLRQRDADRARGNMQSAGCKIGDHAIAAENQTLDRLVIGQHGHDRIPATSLGNAGGELRALCNQRFCFCRCAIKNGNAMTGLEQIGRHAGAHATKADEAHIHKISVC